MPQWLDAVVGHVDPADELLLAHERLAQSGLDARRHAGPGLARADDDNAVDRVELDALAADEQLIALDAHALLDEPPTIDGIEPSPPNGQRVGSKLL